MTVRMSTANVINVDYHILIHGDCREVILPSFDAVCTDPPYGIQYKVNKRNKANRGVKLKATRETETIAVDSIAGDDKPFDPAPWLNYEKVALFGAQHFSDCLPLGRWLIWDKRCDSAQDDHSDADLIWMTGNHKEAMRIHRQKWRGVVRQGEENCSISKKLHPNQKPVALLNLVVEKLNLMPGQAVIDPYMGSGSTGVSCVRRGLQFVGIEIDQNYFEIAVDRIRREVSSFSVCQS